MKVTCQENVVSGVASGASIAVGTQKENTSNDVERQEVEDDDHNNPRLKNRLC